MQAYSASSDETRKESIVLSYEEFNALKTQVLSSLHQTNTEKGTERIEKIARFLNERLGARTTVLEKSRAHKTLGAAPHQNLAETCSLILNHFNIYPQNLASQKPAHASYDIRKELRDAGIPEDEIDANFQVPSPHQGSVAHGSHAGAMQRSSMEHDLAQTLRMLEAAGISQDNIAFSQRFGQTSSAQQQQAVEVVSPHLAHTSSAVATPSIEWGVEFEESSEHNPLPKVSSPKFLTLQGKPNKDSIKLLHRNISTERALGFLSNVSKMSRNLKYVFDDAGFYEPSQIHLSLLSGIGSTRASTLFALDNMKTLLTEIQPLCLTKNPFKITGLDFYVHDEKKDSWRTFNLDTQDAASITKDLKTCPDINYGYVVLRAQGIEENPTSCSLKRKWTNPSFLEGSEEFLFDRKMPYNPHITIAQVGVEDTSSFQQLNKKTWVKWQPADVESIVTAVSKIRVSTDKLSNLALGKIAVSTKVRGQILCLGYNDLDSHTVRVNQGLWESTFRGDY
ncbi:MAG: hypothetical protein ACK5PQ_05225 [Alphaproteobacteria bacterium]